MQIANNWPAHWAKAIDDWPIRLSPRSANLLAQLYLVSHGSELSKKCSIFTFLVKESFKKICYIYILSLKIREKFS